VGRPARPRRPAPRPVPRRHRRPRRPAERAEGDRIPPVEREGLAPASRRRRAGRGAREVWPRSGARARRAVGRAARGRGGSAPAAGRPRPRARRAFPRPGSAVPGPLARARGASASTRGGLVPAVEAIGQHLGLLEEERGARAGRLGGGQLGVEELEAPWASSRRRRRCGARSGGSRRTSGASRYADWNAAAAREGFPADVPTADRARGTAARFAGRAPAAFASRSSPAMRARTSAPQSRREPWGARPALPAREVRSCGVRGARSAPESMRSETASMSR
jgi:hypothetical protein